jgi:hypothetical protein
MARFISIPPLDIGSEPEQWVLTDECVYESDIFPRLITVPEGFETDLASIPRVFRFLIVKNGKHRAAAIIHDWLCRLGLEFQRSLADKMFLEAMKVCKVPKWRRYPMYWAVAINTKRMKIIGKAR